MPTKIKELAEFNEYLKDLIINPSTLVNYNSQIRQYFNAHPSLLEYTNDKHEKAAITWLSTKNNTSAKAVVGHFYKALCMYEFWNRFKIKYRRQLTQKERKHARKSVSVETLFKIFGTAPMPYHLIYWLQYETGSRITEILNIEKEDISFDEDLPCIWIKVLKTNGTLIKTNYITPKTGEKLAKYIAKRNIKEGKIFNRGYDMCNIMLKKSTKRAGYTELCERISTHWIRHTRANYVYSLKKDIITVKKMLGHKSIKTTETYLAESGETSKEIIQLEMNRRDEYG